MEKRREMSSTEASKMLAAVPKEHHALVTQAVEAGFNLDDILAVLAKYGAIVLQILRDLFAPAT